MKEIIRDSLRETRSILETFINNEANIESIYNAADICAEALQTGHKIICCGNGGSLCDATHFAEELTGRFRNDRRPLPALAINDPAYMTCVGNDFSFDEIFSRYVEAMGKEGDVLLAISTSGHSRNIINAVDQAHINRMKVIALTSLGKNELIEKADVVISTPSAAHSDPVSYTHLTLPTNSLV